MHESPESIISDADVERVHGFANFGSTPKREVVREAVLSIASGYTVGSTARATLLDHALVHREVGDRAMRRELRLTEKGRRYLFAAHYKP